jgi:tight adherence protein B
MDVTYLLFALALFVAVVLGFEGLYLMWASKRSAEVRRVAARLQSIEAALPEAATSIERRVLKSRWSGLDALVARLPNGEALKEFVNTSGVETTAGQVLASSIGLGLLGGAVPALFDKPWTFSLAGGLVLAIIPWLRLSRARTLRMRTLERQIPEALDLMARGMRAGHAFPTAVKMVGEEMAEPIAREFRILFDESNYGVPLNEALLRLSMRVPITDLRYFVIAVIIQRESGGNLAELLDNIGTIVRARLKLLGEVRTLSAEGRLSAWILGSLPFVVAGAVQLLNPKFMSVLWTDPIGLKLVGGALVMMVFGLLWMRKIIRIRV